MHKERCKRWFRKSEVDRVGLHNRNWQMAIVKAPALAFNRIHGEHDHCRCFVGVQAVAGLVAIGLVRAARKLFNLGNLACRIVATGRLLTATRLGCHRHLGHRAIGMIRKNCVFRWFDVAITGPLQSLFGRKAATVGPALLWCRASTVAVLAWKRIRAGFSYHLHSNWNWQRSKKNAKQHNC